MNVKRQSVSKWELGKVYLGIDILVQMSDIFDITLDELIKGGKDLKKTIIETYRSNSNAEVTNTTNDRPMNGWEFLSNFWWLIFPVGGMLMAIRS